MISKSATLTTSSLESNENGLYKSTATNSGNPTYYFRGNIENNYVDFAGFIWRIVRINEDGTIRIIKQDSINDNVKYQWNNVTDFTGVYYSNSEVKSVLEDWYQKNIEQKPELAIHVAVGNYFCEQAKVKGSSAWYSGNATMPVYTEYISSFKCVNDSYGKGLVNTNIGLITYDEVIHAGLYIGKAHQSIYLYNTTENHGSWVMSPAGIHSIHPMVYELGKDLISTGWTSGTSTLRPVINLTSDTRAIGIGSYSHPYKVN